MKIIFLNCWNGRLEKPFFDFIKKNAKNTDVFCFQEVSTKLSTKIESFLVGYTKVENRMTDNPFSKNLVTYVKKTLIFKTKIEDSILVYLNKKLLIANIHGDARPGHKLDTKKRIELSKKLINFSNKNEFTIMGGDFNLMPRTKSIKMFEEKGLKNLIREFNVKRTRNEHAWNQALRMESELGYRFYGKQRFSDYCFVSKNIFIKSFEVPDVKISDHLPLILEFEV